MRRLCAALLTILFAVGLCVPSVARAEVAWQNDGDRKTAVVSGYPYTESGRCSALMEYLGFDWSSIGSDARNKLLTNSGGDNPFTQSLAQVKNVQYETNGTLNWPIISIWSTIFGLSEQWDISLTYTQYDNTVAYVRGVITGGGGSTGGGDNKPEINELYEYLPSGGSKAGYVYTLAGVSGSKYSQITVDLEKIKTTLDQRTDWIIVSGDTTTDNRIWGYFALSLPDGVYAVREKSTGYLYVYNSTTETQTYGYQRLTPTYGVNIDTSTGTYIPNSGGTINMAETIAAGEYEKPNNQSRVANYVYMAGVTTPTPTPPQPDPPVTPPVTPTPPVYTPTPIGDPTVTTPDYSEIIDWLEQLHIDLQAIEQQIVDTFNTLDADLANWFTRLSDYVGDMVEWLADELEQYWDGLESNIVMWLKRIYSRMGGNGATKPDPTTDPKGFWEWLLEQFASFFAGNVDDAVDTLADKLEELVQFFPFSIPWDIMALFALFAADPVTPVFDIQLPVPTVVNSSQHIAISIDLTPYDSTMQVVRAIEKVIFAGWLASMVPTWLNQIKVSDKL